MGRAVGVRNADYDIRRQSLLDGATDFVLREEVVSPSLRQIAIAVGASDPTIKHYFGTRTEFVGDILKNIGQRCEPWRAQLRQGFPTIREALDDFVVMSRSLPENQMLVQANLFALRESLNEPAIFQAYVRYVVEPNIEALAERLVRSPGGPKNYATARAAAGMLTSNLSMIALRQIMLGDSDEVAMSVGERFAFTMNWMSNGLLNDPDAEKVGAA